MKQIKRTLCSTLAITIMAWSTAPMCAAQHLNALPGLWLKATQTKVNGEALPGLLDAYSELPAAHKTLMANILKQAGLPEGWSPQWSCVTKESLDVQTTANRLAKNCPSPTIKASTTSVSFEAKCVQDGATALVTGEISTSGPTELRQSYQSEATVEGTKYLTDNQSVGKWVGTDCTAPPKGVSRELFEMLLDSN